MTPETNKVTLGKDTFPNILGMLESPDPENRVVALSCIDNVDFNSNITYILILKKEGTKATTHEWLEHAPNASKLLKGMGIELDKALTYKQILETIVKRKVPSEDIQFYLDSFGLKLFQSIKGLGYDFIDELEINIKLKTSDGEQTGTISKSLKGPDA